MVDKKLATKISDIERVISKYDSPVLGSHFRATLPVGRAIRLLISLQGQNKINQSTLNSIAHSEIGISSYELSSAYLPLFQDWDLIDVYDDYIIERIKSRDTVLDRTGKWWDELTPHPVESLSLNLFNLTSKLPQPSDLTQTVLDQYAQPACTSAVSHLRGSGLLDTFLHKDTLWYYSPEIFGENYNKVIKYLATQTDENRSEIKNIIDTVSNDQGVPYDSLVRSNTPKRLEQVSGVGIIYGYPLSIGNINSIFYFTPELKSRFEREGRGDKYEIIKPGVSHFQFAHKLARGETGRLKLNPSVFLNSLIEKGFAGNATAIGTDYELLVKKGLVKLEPTYANRYRFLLPDSREKIADLEAIRDAFESDEILPQIDFSEWGLKGEILTSDSLVYRSRNFIKGKPLAQEFCREVFKL